MISINDVLIILLQDAEYLQSLPEDVRIVIENRYK